MQVPSFKHIYNKHNCWYSLTISSYSKNVKWFIYVVYLQFKELIFYYLYPRRDSNSQALKATVSKTAVSTNSTTQAIPYISFNLCGGQDSNLQGELLAYNFYSTTSISRVYPISQPPQFCCRFHIPTTTPNHLLKRGLGLILSVIPLIIQGWRAFNFYFFDSYIFIINFTYGSFT